MQYLVSFLVLQSSRGGRARRAGCFTLIVLLLFTTVPWVGLLYVGVVFPDHTHLLFHVIFDTSAVLVKKSQFTGLKIDRKSIKQTLTVIDTKRF